MGLPCGPSGAFKKGTPIEGWHLGTKHPSLETPESVTKMTSSSMELRAGLLSDWVGLEGNSIDVQAVRLLLPVRLPVSVLCPTQ